MPQSQNPKLRSRMFLCWPQPNLKASPGDDEGLAQVGLGIGSWKLRFASRGISGGFLPQ